MKKRIFPIMMAAIMMAVSVPVTVGATGENGETTDVVATPPEETGVDPSVSDPTTTDTGIATTEEPVVVEETPAPVVEETEPLIIEPEQVESDNVVTLGENLTEEQRAAMYSYFGVDPNTVRTIIVTHADEVRYMEGIATAEQIGNSTNSCAYVEPTTSGGIKVKTANLNYVTSAMIASTLTTAGMENCNVIAACPFEVSGTGALTGIIMAYEQASGEVLDEGKKEAAMEELIITGALADTIGQEMATEVMNDIKTEILDKGYTDPEQIGEAVDKIAAKYEVTLTEDQKNQIISLMQQISQFDYDLGALKDTLDNLSGQLSGLANVWNSIKTFFVGSGDGILSGTNDAALGTDFITDSTVSESGFQDGLITRIVNFFKGLAE